MARLHHQPLLSGGTSASGGSCAAYVPGNTPCLACLIDVDRLAQREASVVTSNAITGALMVWMLQEMMAGRLRGGVWEYDGGGATRGWGCTPYGLRASVIWRRENENGPRVSRSGGHPFCVIVLQARR
ncbi:MAG: hypothetical protein VYD18_14610 [Candidatus Latescibacterota bacterium]|nr:hypothetical protein [Candidatus Latescibacterota bacterium]